MTTTSSSQLAAPTVPTPGPIWVCTPCQTTAGPFTATPEAQLLAEIHDELHHHGRRTAAVDPRTDCESCHHNPAVTTWTAPAAAGAAGTTFAMCTSCAPRQPGDAGAQATGNGAHRR